MINSPGPSGDFLNLVDRIGDIGKKKHVVAILDNVAKNSSKIAKSIKQLDLPTGKKGESAIIISGGPSVLKQNSIERISQLGFEGSVISADASYISCLRRGVIPDYVLTLDPHPTRIVRWFGDPNYEEHAAKDDYFERQDINIEFRKNSLRQNEENIKLVNEMGRKTKAIVATTAPANVIQRLEEARFDILWWNPLVDDPKSPESITKKIYDVNKLPCLNTGGNVGTASWVFASSVLNISRIGLVGMDLGYYKDTPYNLTQTYYELASYLGGEEGIEDFFCEYVFPLTGEKFYTDPTYFWYRKNFLELLQKNTKAKTFNCTEGGTLFSENLTCVYLEEFIRLNRSAEAANG